MKPFGLLACDVFRDEIEMLGAPSVVEYLEMGLHDQPDQLREAIQNVILRMEDDPGLHAIALAYGMCGQGLAGIRSHRLPLVLPRAHDCIAIMLGGMAAFRRVNRECPNTYFYSPGWMRGGRTPGPERNAQLHALYSARYPDDPEIVGELLEADQETFAHYQCAGYLDITGNDSAKQACQECARALGWRFQQLPGDASFLRELLSGQWDDARFQIVLPGHQLTTRDDDLVFSSQLL